MEKDRNDTPDQNVFDAATWAEACDVFGKAQALSYLYALRDDLIRHLAWTSKELPNLGELKKMAHQVAGRTGFLGLTDLCAASARLDEAAQRGTHVETVLDRWRKEAQRAVDAIATR